MLPSSRRKTGKKYPKNRGTKRRWSYGPMLEALEHRVVPVLDPYAPIPVPPGFVTPDGVPLDGVVQLNWPLPGGMQGTCTGAFLGDDERQGSDDKMTPFTRAGNAQHILTAAHCVTDESGKVDVPEVTVSYYLPSKATPYTFTVPSSNYRLLDGIWDGNSEHGDDIALLDLGEIGPVGPAGIGAPTYAFNTVFNEKDKECEFAGYGNTGTGNNGQQGGTSGTKRYGYNVFNCMYPKQMSYDFDSGSIRHNSLEFICGSDKTPVKTHDSYAGQGDSGGPSFHYDAIAGVNSHSIGGIEGNFKFGSIGVVERVSSHKDWIRDLLNVPRDITLNMANQPFGGDGGADRIDVDRSSDNRVVIWVNNNFWVDLPTAGVKSLTIVGSGDNEDVHIDQSLGETVTFTGNGGTNQLFIKDTNDKLQCTVDANKLSCVKLYISTHVNWQNVSTVTLGNGAGDKVVVRAVSFGTPVTVWNASTVDVGSGKVNAINDVVNVHNATTLNVRDTANKDSTDYDIHPNQLNIFPNGVIRTVNYFNVPLVNMLGGSGGNEFTVFGTSAITTRLANGHGQRPHHGVCDVARHAHS